MPPSAPVAATLQAGGPADWVESLLAGLGPTALSVVVSAAVVAVAVAVTVYLAPWLLRRLAEIGASDTLDGEPATGFVSESLRLIALRAVQLSVLVATVLALASTWGVDVGQAFDDLASIPRVANVAITLAVVFVAYVAIDLLDDAVGELSRRSDLVSDHEEEIIRRVAQLSVLALAFATGLTIWVEDLSGLLVGAGFLGIVVGLAARQTLGSLIAGFVLMFSRPFTIGDWVEIGDQEGIVTDITIVNTRLENFDGEFVVIPNDTVGNQPITNRSRKGHLRIRQDVGVDYESDPDRACEVAVEAMDAVDAVEPTPPPQALLKAFGDSAVVIELRFWIDHPTPPRKWQARNAVVGAVKTAFEAEGIKIPFPQRELTGRAEAGGFQTVSEPIEEGPGTTRGRPDQASGDGERQAAESDARTED